MQRIVPFRLGSYDCQQRLGGNYGEVYFAVDINSFRQVLVKIMEPFGQPAMFRQRFLVEARVACQCVHPNLIQTYEAGEIDGEYAIVTEIPQGDTLRGLLDRGAYEAEDEILSIAWQVSHTMAFLHGFGIVHRDLKPENIIIGPDGTVKLFDFGIARLTESKLPTEGDVAGTPLYMAPEQVRGEQAGKPSDIYSFGVLLYHLITRGFPYRMSGHEDLYNAIVHREPNLQPVHDRRLQRTALADLVGSCLRKSPAERPQSFDKIEALLLQLAQPVAPSASSPQQQQQPLPVLEQPSSAAMLRAMALPPPIPGEGPMVFQSMQNPVMVPSTAKFAAMTAAAKPSYSAPPPTKQVVIDSPSGVSPAGAIGTAAGATAPRRRRGRWIWPVAALLFLGALGGGGWYFWPQLQPLVSGSSAKADSPVQLSSPLQKVPAGTAMVGRDREVVQVGAFEIDQMEVSVRDYLEFCRRTGRMHPDPLEDLDPQLPIVNVSYDDAKAFAKWAGKRLPAPLEWEKAARGEDGRKFPWGNEPLLERANVGNTGYLARANARGDGASPYGVLNLLGNVWEWVEQPMKLTPEDFQRIQHLFKPPLDINEPTFQIRGGSYMHLTSTATLEELIWDTAAAPARTRRKDIGFRCARDVK